MPAVRLSYSAVTVSFQLFTSGMSALLVCGPVSGASRALGVVLADGLDLERDAHFVADHDTAAVSGGVELDAKVAAVDLGGGREPDPRVAERRGGLESVELQSKRDRAGDAVERELAVDDEAVTISPHARGPEGHLRVL